MNKYFIHFSVIQNIFHSKLMILKSISLYKRTYNNLYLEILQQVHDFNIEVKKDEILNQMLFIHLLKKILSD